MSMSTLSPSGLRIWDGGDDFATHMAYNITRMNNLLLKLNALPEVTACTTEGDVLIYDAITDNKWEPHTPPAYAQIRTTTTTTV